MNTLNTETHSSKEIAEFSLENADIESIFMCKERIKSKLSLSSECVETKICKPRTPFTSHRHCWCGMVWYRALRVKQPVKNTERNTELITRSPDKGLVELTVISRSLQLSSY